jgi:hypothetical protein
LIETWSQSHHVKRTIIFAALILICAFAIYLYAHHNWNTLPSGTTIDRIVVEKSARRLSVFGNGNQMKTYRIALGRNPLGAKQEEGDMKTPEGIYKIDGRNPQSNFHLALHVSYPSDEDDKRAAARGVSAGFDIMTKRSRNSGALHRTVRQSRFVHERPGGVNDFSKGLRARVALFRHQMAAG